MARVAEARQERAAQPAPGGELGPQVRAARPPRRGGCLSIRSAPRHPARRSIALPRVSDWGYGPFRGTSRSVFRRRVDTSPEGKKEISFIQEDEQARLEIFLRGTTGILAWERQEAWGRGATCKSGACPELNPTKSN